MRKIKKDKDYRSRDGFCVVISIGCSNCEKQVLVYQKDGHGSLKRLYLNRILAPERLAKLQDTMSSVKDMDMLKCGCGNELGMPMYHRGGRLAFRLFSSSFTKEKM